MTPAHEEQQQGAGEVEHALADAREIAQKYEDRYWVAQAEIRRLRAQVAILDELQQMHFRQLALAEQVVEAARVLEGQGYWDSHEGPPIHRTGDTTFYCLPESLYRAVIATVRAYDAAVREGGSTQSHLGSPTDSEEVNG